MTLTKTRITCTRSQHRTNMQQNILSQSQLQVKKGST